MEKTCCICICNILDNKLYTCSPNEHYICFSCMDRYIEQSHDNSVILDYWKLNSNLKCFACDGYFDDEKMIETGNFNYVKFTRNIIKTITTISIQSTSMKKKEQSNFLSVIKNEIRDELTKCISCPYCQLSFIDFQGCMALTCSNCKKGFCGVCCKQHPIDITDNHIMVKSHTLKFSSEFKKRYGFTGSYFISEQGWELWKDKLKTEAIIAYLSKLRIEIVWTSASDILFMLSIEKLLSFEGINKISLSVYSANLSFGKSAYQGFHLIRIPIVFWTIYSYKKDIKFEETLNLYKLTTQEKLEMGKIIVDKIISKYPGFEIIQHKVPGETYYANNYPIEMAPLIYKTIEQWGRMKNIW
jgi:hypothetical protein